jgi:benzylsuccinate CoA-transferase BbsF subunit
MDHRQVFDGVKVVDFSWVGVGPITAKYLADHGAEVIRIDSLARPDPLRAAPPWADATPGLNRSQFYANFNTSKYGVSLDLSQPKGRVLAKRLVARADIVIESFTPRVMKNWGLDYPALAQVRPELIMLSTCQQGQTGPHAQYPGYGNLMAALAGFYDITGWADRPPAPPYGAYTDFIVPRFAAAAVIAALDYRRRTGKGQYIDISQFEAALQFLAPLLLDYTVNGRVMRRQGNADARMAPHGAYRCQGEERWCVIAVATEDEWRALCRAMGDPPWTQDPRFTTLAGRLAHREVLDGLVETWTRRHTPEEVTQRLQAHGVAAGVVAACTDLHRDPQLRQRGFFVELPHREMGTVPYDGLQFTLSQTPGALRWAAPCLGEHNEYVFRELLGLSEEEYVQCVIEEVIF